MSRFRFPARVYPIVDTLGNPTRSHLDLAAALFAAGAPLIQLRVKQAPTRRICELASAIQALAVEHAALLIVNDRADIALVAGAAGVHLGQEDLPPTDARRILGPDRIIGWSTHSVEQVTTADRGGAVDYIGFGPIFATRSKENPDPVQGIDGLQRARAATRLPIVAIGGLTAEVVPEAIRAGADAIATIGAVVGAPDPAAAFLDLLRSAG